MGGLKYNSQALPSKKNHLNLSEWLDYQDNLHIKNIDLGLERIKKVYDQLFIHKHKFKIITVAGTNGKGSTIAFLESIYYQAGYKVGKFSSPHIIAYNERIRVNKRNTTDELLCWAFAQIEQARKDIVLTYFEFSALTTLLIFTKQQVDIALLEVGLGGRLDAINVVDTDCAVITNIDIDHTEYLGDTREKIAIEKMGIMRANKPCVCADTNPPKPLLDNKNITFVKEKYQGKLGLLGEHQKINAQLTLEAIKHLGLKVSEKNKQLGLENTELFGRQQKQQLGNKTFIFDVAHNTASVTALIPTIKSEPNTIAIFAALKDKNIAEMLDKITPFIKEWLLIPLDSNRSISTETLQKIFPKNTKLTPCKTAKEATNLAENSNAKQIVVFGSFITVANCFNALRNI